MIVARVRRTVRERGLIPRGARVLAACSGGPDSGAMLFALARLCAELDFELEAASVDHGLRADAAADVDVARAQAERAGVAFHALRIVVEKHASLQASARVERYRALLGLARDLGAQRVAVGHTQDDQAETLVMRLMRGSSIAGLGAIEPKRRDGVIRPLIDCRRADVLAFAQEHCPQIAIDPSNRDPRFERSRVRATILPTLLEESPGLVAHLADLADDAREAHAAVDERADQLLETLPQADGRIDVSSWLSAPLAVRRSALRRWLESTLDLELGRAHITAAEQACRAPAEVWLPRGFVLRSEGRGVLRLTAESEAQPMRGYVRTRAPRGTRA